MERESMSFDVVIVGAGPAGLSTACRLAQLAAERAQTLSICVVEKGSEVGAHILSGAVVETRALDELFADWRERGAPLNTPVTTDEMYWLSSSERGHRLPKLMLPAPMHNAGNQVISLANLCRWLAQQAEDLGVEVFPGFAASEVLYEGDRVVGVVTGDMGVDRAGNPKDGYMPGMELRAGTTVFAEGARGHLGKQLQARFDLARDADPQHYGLGLKELWDIPADQHQPGKVMHGAGWPLGNQTGGGWFLYHLENQQAVVGLIVDLNYSNPHLSPFDEFQRLKHHPVLAASLAGGTRVSFGARAIAKGGHRALPRMAFSGGVLIGCDAGTLNMAKIKGTHTAMKSGMLAAEAIVDGDLASLDARFDASWAGQELRRTKNFGPALHRFGALVGGAYNALDQNLFGGRLPFALRDLTPDHQSLRPAASCARIDYPKPDGVLSFDKLSSVYLSNTAHEEDQPVHLRLADGRIPLGQNLSDYDEPAQRYCPAGVYEITEVDGATQFQINAQNCVHCKTCDIKDPAQNITWWVPEGGGGPNYPNM